MVFPSSFSISTSAGTSGKWSSARKSDRWSARKSLTRDFRGLTRIKRWTPQFSGTTGRLAALIFLGWIRVNPYDPWPVLAVEGFIIPRFDLEKYGVDHG
jgi:hypothetical protein